MRPLVAEINLQALRHNARLLRRRASGAGLYGVVKANAYGHGLVEVATALQEDVERFAVACLDEATLLREAGIRAPLLVMQGFYSVEELIRGNRLGAIEWALHDASQLAMLESLQNSEEPGSIHLWLKFNTGMNRLGFPPSEAQSLMDKLSAMPSLRLAGVMSHFACADEPEKNEHQQQMLTLEALASGVPARVPRSFANSAGLFLESLPAQQWARPGIALYGGSPQADRNGEDFGLKPVMHLKSALIAKRTLQPGDSVGYGASWKAKRETPMGIVAVGYGDGYPRQIDSGAPVWVAGKRCQTIGRVSMDMIAVDLSPCTEAAVGAPVELWGTHVSADEVARHASTIAYHLFTGVTPRVPRCYL